MRNIIQLIREINKGGVIEHHTKTGTFQYTILYLSEREDQPINFKVVYFPHEEDEDE